MDDHRWLAVMGIAIGLPLTVMPSSIAHTFFLNHNAGVETSQSGAIARFLQKGMSVETVRSSQRQSNTITLDAADLGEPHELRVETSANLTGVIKINGESVATLAKGTTTLDIAPYLVSVSLTTVEVTGSYSPSQAVIQLQFEGPSVLISQQSSGMGQLDYRLHLDVN